MVAKRLGWPMSYVIYGAAIGHRRHRRAAGQGAGRAPTRCMEAKAQDAKRNPLAAGVWTP